MTSLKTESTLISVKDALDICREHQIEVTTETIRTWCEKYNIGRKIVGRWGVNEKKLKLLLDGRNANKEKKK